MNLYNEIMNMQCRVPRDANVNQRLAWKEGHKQARHDAAELALVVEAEVERLRQFEALARETQQRAPDIWWAKRRDALLMSRPNEPG